MRFTYLVIVLLTLAGCAKDSPATFDSEEVRDSVTSAMLEYGTAWKSLDANRIAAFFSTDSATRVVDGQTVYTSQTLRSALESFATNFKSYDGGITENSIVVMPLSSSHAVVMSAFEDIFTDTSGKVTSTKGAQMTVWARQANQWRIIAMQTAPSAPVESGAK